MARFATAVLVLLWSCFGIQKTLATGKGFFPLGCYSDASTKRLLPVFIKDFRNDINWKNMSLTVQQCVDEIKRLELEKGTPYKYKYFAIQFYGECWAGEESVANQYFISGSSVNCYDGTGGSRINFVYQFGTEIDPSVPTSFSVGCYNANHDPPPFPIMIDFIKQDFDWLSGLNEAQQALVSSRCARKAAKAGFKAYGIKHGECWSGLNAELTYFSGGEAHDCKDELGSDNSFTVYLFAEESSS